MPKNTDKDSSKLRLSNGSTIDISKVQAEQPSVTLDPITGNFTISKDSSTSGDAWATSNSGSFNVKFDYTEIDYQEKFEEKRQGMHDIVEDGDGLTREMVHDLVLTANKAVWQESKRSD